MRNAIMYMELEEGVLLVEEDGTVWKVFSRPWWDIASWVWWFFSPGPKIYVLLKLENGDFFKSRAVKIGTRLLYSSNKLEDEDEDDTETEE